VQQAAPEDSPPVTPAQPAAGSEYGPVRSGETLWAIASDWSRGSGLNINRVMIAIQRENPDAFLRDNINLLKRGAILRMPSMDAVNEISAASAYQEVVAQEQAFSGRAAASVASAETPLLAEESVLPAPAEEPPAAAPAEPAPAETPEQMPEQATEQAPEEVSEQAAADTAAPVEAATSPATTTESAPAQDLLELVPPSADSELDSTSGFEEAAPGGETDVAAQALREELARAEEELINQQQQNEYLEERIRELESQLAGRDEEGTVADRDLASMEDRLREQRQAAPAPGAAAKPEQAKPWYARIGFWLIGLLVVVAAFVGWRFSRRGAVTEVAVADPAESLRGIKSEAEDLLRVLADDRERKPAAGAAADQPRQDAGRGAGQNAGNDAAAEAAAPAAPADKASPVKAGVVEDAELLDEDSSDPEIQLDLARAYISMGDKEAARVILQEVVNNGSEAQQAEARKMLGFL
jgi:FimV-like protein